MHTEKFDNKLLEYENYKRRPIQLPFIGNKYIENEGILFILESHYVCVSFFEAQYDTINLSEKNPELFYNTIEDGRKIKDITKKTNGFTEAFINHIHTRNVIKERLNKDKKTSNRKSVFEKLSDLLKECYSLKKNETGFENIAVYNYFQRPSYKLGKTIKLCKKDVEIGYDTLKHIVETIRPKKIIFLSNKAYDSFKKINTINVNPIVEEKIIYRGTHPNVWGSKCTYEPNITWRQWLKDRLKK